MTGGGAEARPQSAPAASKSSGVRSGKGRKNKRGKRGGRGGKGGGGGGGGGGRGRGGRGTGGTSQPRQTHGQSQVWPSGSPPPVAEARQAAADCFGTHTVAKERAVRAWCAVEVAAEQPSDCGCFAWEIEKCHTVRTVPRWSADTEASDVAYSIELPPALHREGKPFAVLAEAALATAEGSAEYAKTMESESPQMLNDLFVALYQNVQSHTLRVSEFCTLIDLVGDKRRREIQLGPILRSINSRSCPAAVDRRGFEVISSQAYCQICHRVGVENGVSRCGGCGVVAYCSKRHAQMDSCRHQSWCKELLFSRVLQSALPWSNYVDTSRRLVVPFTPTSVMVGGSTDRSEKQVGPLPLPAGWREFFDLHQTSAADLRADGSDQGSEKEAVASRKEPDGALHFFDKLLATDALSSILTVAYALTKLGLAKPLTPSGGTKQLCLHLLGADHERELPWPELFSWLPHTEINIVLIGPHTQTMAERDIDTNGTNVPVPPGCKMTIQGVAGCFHEISSDVLGGIPDPDAVFALNSGLIFYPTWADTVDRVLAKGVAPFVVSAWAQPEALGVRQMLLDSHGIPLSDQGLDLDSNPFASLVPQAVMDDHGTCNFNNRYLLAVARKNSAAMRRYRDAPAIVLQAKSELKAPARLKMHLPGNTRYKETKGPVLPQAKSQPAPRDLSQNSSSGATRTAGIRADVSTSKAASSQTIVKQPPDE